MGGTTTWFSSLFKMHSEHAKDSATGSNALHSPPMVSQLAAPVRAECLTVAAAVGSGGVLAVLHGGCSWCLHHGLLGQHC